MYQLKLDFGSGELKLCTSIHKQDTPSYQATSTNQSKHLCILKTQLTNPVVAQRIIEMSAPSCGRGSGIECQSCKELTGIETQLEERRYQALVKRNYVHSPLVHQFPLKINTCIFLLAFPPQEACSWCSNIPHDKAGPLILTKVCQTWRALALSIPRLWSCISFDTENPNFPLLNHQISHTGTVPLTVFLVFGYGLNQERSLANAKQAMSIISKGLFHFTSFSQKLPWHVVLSLA